MKTNNNGVTLIALVITIIVLLILAGVSIATLMGPNGIITNAKQAEIDNAKGDLEEAVKLAISELRIENAASDAIDIKSGAVLAKVKTINTRFNTAETTNPTDTEIVYVFKGKDIKATITTDTGAVAMSVGDHVEK